jgi:hypothetical protein
MSFQKMIVKRLGADSDIYHANADAFPVGDSRKVVSSGFLREFAVCPARLKNGYQPPDTGAKQYGSRLDCWHLTPERWREKYALQPEAYASTGMKCPKCGTVTDSAKCRECKTERKEVQISKPWTNQSATCAEWTAARHAEGKSVMTKEEQTEVELAHSFLMSDKIVSELHACSQKQVWIAGEWHDTGTGLVVPVQMLIDYAPDKESDYFQCLADLKTTRSAHPAAWSKYSSQRKYHVQAAFYLDGYNAATGEMRDTFCHVLSENFPPYQVGRSMLSLRKVDIGRALYQSWLSKYCLCLKTGVWPDYTQKTALDGWNLDDATKWDEAEGLAAMEQDAPPADEIPEEEPEVLN